MAEYIESICRSCFHSYVCEQFNEHRDSNNQKCHFFNDHFVPAADVVEVVRCKDCKWCSQSGLCNLYIGFTPSMKPDDFCSYGERMGADMSGDGDGDDNK